MTSAVFDKWFILSDNSHWICGTLINNNLSYFNNVQILDVAIEYYEGHKSHQCTHCNLKKPSEGNQYLLSLN